MTTVIPISAPQVSWNHTAADCRDKARSLGREYPYTLPHKRPGAQAVSLPADSSRMDKLDCLAAEIRTITDHVDILFTNSGAAWGEKFDSHPEKMFSKVMDLNVKSVFYTIQR